MILRAFGAWYRDIGTLIVFNLMWVALLLLVATAAPATAGLYAVAARVADGEYIGWRDYVAEVRRYFVKAWLWFVPQVIIYGIGLFNLSYYAGQTSNFWVALRWFWTVALLFWTVLQLLYWPILIEEADQSFGNTLRNAFLMVVGNPLFFSILFVFVALLIIVSMLTTAPVGVGLGAWLALIGTYAVRDRLAIFRERKAE